MDTLYQYKKYIIKMSNIAVNAYHDRLFRHIFIFICLPVFICGCKDDREDYNYYRTGKEAMVSFSVRVPGVGVPKTYALDEFDENEVKTIDILLFDSSSGEYIAEPIYSNTILSNPDNIRIKTFTVKVLEGTYDMVVLANSHQSLTNILSDINLGDSKVSVLEKLLVHNAGKWNTDSDSNGYIPIPMWGEISGITVTSEMSSNIPLTLLRMVAKIDVTLTSDEAKNKFELKSVRLYNYNNKGSIAPAAINWSSEDNVVTAPSIPVLATKPENAELSPLLYDGNAVNRGISCTSEIYTFEALAGSSTNLHSNTCLVIGGIYETNSNETYYRIDFTNTSENTVTYLPLLRNHCYKVNITALGGAGYTSPEEAFKYPTFNVESEIISWNESKITDIVYDEQYMLGVSQREYVFSREERTIDSDDNVLSITTDYPEGWKVEKIVDEEGVIISDWLDLQIHNGDAGETTDVNLILTENELSESRKGFIHLVAGRLRTVIQVLQEVDSGKGLSVKDVLGLSVKESNFFSPIDIQPAAQQFILRWLPTTADVAVSIENIGNKGFDFDNSSDKPGISLTTISDPTGKGIYTLNIQPRLFTNEEVKAEPFLNKISKVNFTLFNGINYVSRNIYLHHIHYNVVAYNSSSYTLNGNTYTFRVKSNTDWRIKSVIEETTSGSGNSRLALKPTDNLRIGTVGGNNENIGDLISFTVTNTNTSTGKVKVVFESPVNPIKFNDITVEFDLAHGYYPTSHNGWAGSNIYWDGSKLTFNDIGDYTNQNNIGVYFQWGSLYGISPVDNFSFLTAVYKPDGSIISDMSWHSIPRVNDVAISSSPPVGKEIRDRAYLYEMTNGDAGIGDICKYLTEKGWAPAGKRWRMPTSNEFESENSYNYISYGENGNVNAAGTSFIGEGYKKNDIGQPFFTRSGFRNSGDGTIVNVGSLGYYWSSTPWGTSAYNLYLSTGYLSTAENWNGRSSAFSVRCVAE